VQTRVERISLELSSRPPKAPIAAVALRAHPERTRPVQCSLFGPSTPSPAQPAQLATVMARLCVMPGAERIGAPGIVDGCRPERSLLSAYSPPPPPKVTPTLSALALAVRVLRPRISLVVKIGGEPPRPVFIQSERREGALFLGKVSMAAGPWRMEEGGWSQEAVARSYRDVELLDGEVLRNLRDPKGNGFADGVYDWKK